jgi:LmbE family N-acetylglucosaminyl deacetylase
MGTLVCFHAHPDDEALTTGGTMARAVAEGHRVVLVVATGGEWGEVPEDLAPGETLVQRRSLELDRSAEQLGVTKVVRLGYVDSGMTGWPQNELAGAFVAVPVPEAAARLAEVLRAEGADVLTVYDWHGNYGHPDHVAVHRVGHAAAQLAGVPHVYEATMNRQLVLDFLNQMVQAGVPIDFDPDQTDDGNPFGTDVSLLTTAVDVTGYLDAKRRSLSSHASQVTDTSMLLAMAPEVFAQSFGTEWFVHLGAPPGISESWLAGL